MPLFLLAVAPVLAIAVYVILRDRYEPEPRSRLLGAFLAGGASVLLVALVDQLLGDTQPLLAATSPAVRLTAWILFVGIVEEIAKLIALAPFALSAEANEPLDFVVYGVLVALGFATVENVLYVFGHGAAVGVGRAVLSVPAHAVFGTLTGLVLQRARQQPARGMAYALLALLVPGTVHGVWNFLLSTAAPGYLLLVPFHLALIAAALLALEAAAQRSPFRFRPQVWSHDPVRRDPAVSAERMVTALRRARAALWMFHALGIVAPIAVVVAFLPHALLPFGVMAAGVLGLLYFIEVCGGRDRRLVDVRRLVPAEAGGLKPEALSAMLARATRDMHARAGSTVCVQLDDPHQPVHRQCGPGMRDRRHLEAIPSAACRILEPGDLESLLAERLALRGRLGRLPVLGWAAPLIVTLTMALIAVQAGGLITFIALLLWPAILLPFRLIEQRLIDGVMIAATHLADLDAARSGGVEPLANALLALGAWADRQLLLEVHAYDLARAGALDPITLGTAVAAAREETALDDTRLDTLARGAGRSAAQRVGDIEPLATAPVGGATPLVPREPARRGHRRRRRLSRTFLRRLVRINWRDYDTTLRDGRLDAGELGRLVERLRAEPTLPLFASGAFPEGAYSTPTIRDRLLFLAANPVAPASCARGDTAAEPATAVAPAELPLFGPE